LTETLEKPKPSIVPGYALSPPSPIAHPTVIDDDKCHLYDSWLRTDGEAKGDRLGELFQSEVVNDLPIDVVLGFERIAPALGAERRRERALFDPFQFMESSGESIRPRSIVSDGASFVRACD
jgi:hypothetical protein